MCVESSVPSRLFSHRARSSVAAMTWLLVALAIPLLAGCAILCSAAACSCRMGLHTPRSLGEMSLSFFLVIFLNAINPSNRPSSLVRCVWKTHPFLKLFAFTQWALLPHDPLPPLCSAPPETCLGQTQHHRSCCVSGTLGGQEIGISGKLR